jgi:hypothetical protein
MRTDGRGDTPLIHDSRPAAPEIFALFGPTGVGKTAIAVALANLLRARGEDPVAVSADALQVYAGLETLTGVASAAERMTVEHRLVAFLPLDATFSAGQYAELAHAEIDGLLDAGRRPIVVGGTGLYLRAALTDLDLRRPPPEGARERWTAELERRGAPRCMRCSPSARCGLPMGSTHTIASASCARSSCSTRGNWSPTMGPRSCGARSSATRRCWWV